MKRNDVVVFVHPDFEGEIGIVSLPYSLGNRRFCIVLTTGGSLLVNTAYLEKIGVL